MGRPSTLAGFTTHFSRVWMQHRASTTTQRTGTATATGVLQLGRCLPGAGGGLSAGEGVTGTGVDSCGPGVVVGPSVPPVVEVLVVGGSGTRRPRRQVLPAGQSPHCQPPREPASLTLSVWSGHEQLSGPLTALGGHPHASALDEPGQAYLPLGQRVRVSARESVGQ